MHDLESLADMPKEADLDDGDIPRVEHKGLTTNPASPPPHRLLDELAFYQARPICLERSATSANALRLVESVSNRIIPELNRGRARKLGSKAESRLKGEVGTILAGLLYETLRGRMVNANRGKNATLWKDQHPDSPGVRAFWGKADAMIAAGLLVEYEATRFRDDRSQSGIGGRAGCLVPTTALMALADAAGCVRETIEDDWQAVRERPMPPVPDADLVSLWGFPTVTMGRVDRKADRKRLPLPAFAEPLVGFVRSLNRTADAVTITGAAKPRLCIKFGPTLDFSGRILAGGATSYQRISKAGRKAMTMDGEPVVEVDMKASSLCIALAMLGADFPQDADPYQIGPLAEYQREHVKAWFTASLHGGKLRSRWPDEMPKDERPEYPATRIRDAALAVYPALGRLTDILKPENLTAIVPSDKLIPWAVGQHLSAIEAQILRHALSLIMDQGGVALPMHDALIVPRSWADRAREAIVRASKERLGQPMRAIYCEIVDHERNYKCPI